MEIFEWMFLGEYVKCGDVRTAMLRAGYTGKFARRDGAALLTNPEIVSELSKICDNIKHRHNITNSTVLEDIANVLRADPRDIVTIYRQNCRHCHGIGHAYQWTDGELKKAKIAAVFGHPPPDDSGGVGFDEYADPHLDCPSCGGIGHERVIVKDLRDLTAAQASLIQSVEQTKNGIKITMRSKDSARDAAARILGMNSETINVGDKKLEDMSDAELLTIAMGKK